MGVIVACQARLKEVAGLSARPVGGVLVRLCTGDKSLLVFYFGQNNLGTLDQGRSAEGATPPRRGSGRIGRWMERQRSAGLGFLSPRDGAAAVGARLLSGVTAGVSGMSAQTGKTLKRFYRGFSNAFKVKGALWLERSLVGSGLNWGSLVVDTSTTSCAA